MAQRYAEIHNFSADPKFFFQIERLSLSAADEEAVERAIRKEGRTFFHSSTGDIRIFRQAMTVCRIRNNLTVLIHGDHRDTKYDHGQLVHQKTCLLYSCS